LAGSFHWGPEAFEKLTPGMYDFWLKRAQEWAKIQTPK